MVAALEERSGEAKKKIHPFDKLRVNG